MGFETPEEGYLAKILVQAGAKDVPIGKVIGCNATLYLKKLQLIWIHNINVNQTAEKRLHKCFNISVGYYFP